MKIHLTKTDLRAWLAALPDGDDTTLITVRVTTEGVLVEIEAEALVDWIYEGKSNDE